MLYRLCSTPIDISWSFTYDSMRPQKGSPMQNTFETPVKVSYY